MPSEGDIYVVLGVCGFLAFCIVIVLVMRSAKGQNLNGHAEGCMCPVCAKPKPTGHGQGCMYPACAKPNA